MTIFFVLSICIYIYYKIVRLSWRARFSEIRLLEIYYNYHHRHHHHNKTSSRLIVTRVILRWMNYNRCNALERYIFYIDDKLMTRWTPSELNCIWRTGWSRGCTWSGTSGRTWRARSGCGSCRRWPAPRARLAWSARLSSICGTRTRRTAGTWCLNGSGVGPRRAWGSRSPRWPRYRPRACTARPPCSGATRRAARPSTSDSNGTRTLGRSASCRTGLRRPSRAPRPRPLRPPSV